MAPEVLQRLSVRKSEQVRRREPGRECVRLRLSDLFKIAALRSALPHQSRSTIPDHWAALLAWTNFSGRVTQPPFSTKLPCSQVDEIFFQGRQICCRIPVLLEFIH